MLAGAAALAIVTSRPAAAQTFTATSISEAAQQARREVGRLARQADNILRRTVADGVERGGIAVRRFRAEQASLARDLAAIFNGGVSEDDWLLVVPTRELDLVLTIRPLVIRIAPTADEVEAALKQPLPQVEAKPDDTVEDVLLAIVLAALGLPRPDAALAERLKDDGALAEALKSTAAAVKAHRYGLTALELERLMRVVTLPRNIAAIAEHHGRAAMRTVYKALVVRFVPFVGWTYFDTMLLAAIYANRDGAAPILL
jgi:hypothetical protein